MTQHDLPALPTSVVGSHALPGWLWLAREAMDAGRLGETDLAEVQRDATRLAIDDMTDAGIDIISDGEMGRVNFLYGFYQHLTNLEVLEPRRKLGRPFFDTVPPFRVVGKIAAPRGLGTVQPFRLARAMSAKPMKATCPGPATLIIPLRGHGGYSSPAGVYEDLAAIVNAECRALVEAGAEFIQLDEPNYAQHPSGDIEYFVELFNHAVEGVAAKIAIHICFGNLFGRPWSGGRSYRPMFPALLKVKAQQIVLEFGSRELAELELWKEYKTDAFELGFGCIDVKAFRPESPELVAARIRRALTVCPRQRLFINPDCGLWETPRGIAVQKLKAMVEGTKMVRRG
ncbi:MAG: cobalamin-independent methionine synthase II family protein [Candidatus Tectomicrobia bacterium]|nr:cobalamin-independent methionine synthase II family protein [Candidatus Tectomicrobia bacterium]